jgi:hypothetical protein
MKIKNFRGIFSCLFFFFSCLKVFAQSSTTVLPLPQDQVDLFKRIISPAAQGLGPDCSNRDFWTSQDVTTKTKSVIEYANKLVIIFNDNGGNIPPLTTSPSWFPWNKDFYLESSGKFNPTTCPNCVKGSGGNGERIFFSQKAWLAPLVIAECVDYTGKYLPLIRTVLSSLIKLPTWTWPGNQTEPNNLAIQNNQDPLHYIDLGAAYMAFDIAQAYFMLGNKLNDSLRANIVSTLNSRIFNPLEKKLSNINVGWGAASQWFIVSKNNWNAFCLSGAVGAALAVLDARKLDSTSGNYFIDEIILEKRAKFAAAANYYLQNYYDSFSSDGYSSEGASYWSYSMGPLILLRESLFTNTHSNFDLFNPQDNKLRNKIKEMLLMNHKLNMVKGFENKASFGDALFSNSTSFALAYSSSFFNSFDKTNIKNLGMIGESPGLPQLSTILFKSSDPNTAYGKQTPNSQIQDFNLGIRSFFVNPTGVLVSRPSSNSLYNLGVTIKAGGNDTHNHSDVGSYSIAFDKEQPVGDVGRGSYTSRTFGSDRFNIKWISSYGHPVPVIDGNLQFNSQAIEPKVLSTKFTDTTDEVLIDMKDAYACPAQESDNWKKTYKSCPNNLSSSSLTLTRKMIHNRNPQNISIIDNFSFTDKSRSFETAITSLNSSCIINSNNIYFLKNGKFLKATILSETLTGTSRKAFPFSLKPETITDDGLTFNRIGIKAKDLLKNGAISVKYEPIVSIPLQELNYNNYDIYLTSNKGKLGIIPLTRNTKATSYSITSVSPEKFKAALSVDNKNGTLTVDTNSTLFIPLESNNKFSVQVSEIETNTTNSSSPLKSVKKTVTIVLK